MPKKKRADKKGNLGFDTAKGKTRKYPAPSFGQAPSPTPGGGPASQTPNQNGGEEHG